MTFTSRLLVFAVFPILALLSLQAWYPTVLRDIENVVLPLITNVPFSRNLSIPGPPLRADTPLIVTAFPHWSHYEKIARIAVALADLGYPITFITGRIFEQNVGSLHANITFQPIIGQPDKLSAEDYEVLKTLKPGSVEERVFLETKAFVDGMPDQHHTLQNVFSSFRKAHGSSKPLISLYDVPFGGHIPILLGAPGIKPYASVALSCHPLTLDSVDTYPFHMGKKPHIGSDAVSIHHEANQQHNMDDATRKISQAFWQKAKDLGSVEMHDWHTYHTMAAVPDHLMVLGVPEFEYSRSDLRPNVHYFGAFPKDKQQQSSELNLPEWWDDVAVAKTAGKKIVAVSQGTLGTNMGDLLLPTLEALKDRDDILVIATTVAVEVKDVPNLVIPKNARVAKFVPYDLLIPKLDVLVNNGGFGAVISSLSQGVPMVLAGTGQDKNVTNTIVDWKEVGINLGRIDPTVDQLRDSIFKVLEEEKYRRNAIAMSKIFERYNLSEVFDNVIQDIVRRWQEVESGIRKNDAFRG
ncbi:hypothetical protein FB567DRAFT_129041 [Paraphoma chrysanthemicola]|uniref:Erythromycin biosynthesis protein CIII-like C-terminal domain-containing protein n=1 Tax=Paraphoma chrysanthemicola TaxID=798071 RepID=A0A8K0VV99_9PLEO|nr:hypothetical protein FB567DRAFT_129041 [Paraphoma chrysanthemicola]